ncbi:HK97-gp10 family putative phage morphogenesis protein [Cohnella lubricantis]|uniref:HK97 gp10 family phage protein n=1 Tax=Cohnella lubricantis TaxID=2163172 RepID=A0A841T547_9BACL|nr:HK97-gp10 family putative phage morphogenesis protein [Cohnella lubricantis]MBB6675982.1 HK97 gp10 family phage protein [Cohnella lubricantis]MBP2117899.1 HK97 gp10 family phage protein [Cohnella lubricantis]
MGRVKVDVKITGAEDVLAAFDRFDKASRVNLRSAVRKNANALRKAIQTRAPVDSGNLRDSIAAKYDKDGLGADVGPTRPQGSHAHLLEFGTVKMAAQPFITPSAEEQRDKYLDDVRSAVKGAIP